MKKQQPWDRQVGKGESPAAYQLFWVFLELGIKRSLQGTSEESGRSLGLIAKLSSKYKWAPRARAFDKHLLDMQLKVMESQTKSEGILWAKRETEYRHETFELSEKLKAKAEEMLASPLYETIVETFTEVIGEGGNLIQVPTKVIKHPIRWNFKDVVAMQELSDKLKRQALGMPTARIAVDTTWIADPAQRLVQAKTMMLSWIKTKLESAVARVCQGQPNSNPNEVREKLLAEVPLWFADNYDISDVSSLIEALPSVQELLPAPTALLLDEGEYSN